MWLKVAGLTLAGLLLVAGPGEAQRLQTAVFRASLVAAVAAHGADLATTEHCLGARTCRELNPWLVRYDDPALFGAAKMTVAGLSLWGTTRLKEAGHPRWAIAANLGQAVGFGLIAWQNRRVSQ